MASHGPPWRESCRRGRGPLGAGKACPESAQDGGLSSIHAYIELSHQEARSQRAEADVDEAVSSLLTVRLSDPRKRQAD